MQRIEVFSRHYRQGRSRVNWVVAIQFAPLGRGCRLVCLTVAVVYTAMLAGSAYPQHLDPPPRGTGRVLAHPKIVNLYWHDDWDSVVSLEFRRRAIDDTARLIVTGHYLNGAKQYGVFQGSFQSSHQSSTTCARLRPPPTVSSLDILSWVTCEVNHPGTDVPFPGPDTLYVVHLPPGTVVRNPPQFRFNSCPPAGDGFKGYHTQTPTIPYAVIVQSCVTSFDDFSNTLSHEIVEAATNPFGSGWSDHTASGNVKIGPITIINEGEAADVCASQGGKLAAYFSNHANRCITDQAPSAENSPFAYVTSFNDPSDSTATARVVYLGNDRHIHELSLATSPGAQWAHADLNFAALGNATNAIGVFAFSTSFNQPSDSTTTARVLYLGSDSHIHELSLANVPGARWTHADLNRAALGNATNSAGFPFAYSTSFNEPSDSTLTERVLYLGSDGHIHELSLAKVAGARWMHADLTLLSHAREADLVSGNGRARRPFAYVTSFHAPTDSTTTARVVYLGNDHHIHELSLAKVQGARWTHADLNLSALSNAPWAVSLPFAYSTSFHDPSDSTPTARVLYLGSDSHIHEFSLAKASGARWTHADLNRSALGNAPRATRFVFDNTPIAYETSFNNPGDSTTTARVLYLGTDGHIHELGIRKSPNSRWIHADLSALSHASEAVGFPFAYVTPFNVPGNLSLIARVLYLERNGDIHELSLPKIQGFVWKDADLTEISP